MPAGSRAWIWVQRTLERHRGTDAQRPARGCVRPAGRPTARVGVSLALNTAATRFWRGGGGGRECAWAVAAFRCSIPSGGRPPPALKGVNHQARAGGRSLTGTRGGQRCHISARAGACGTSRRRGRAGWRGSIPAATLSAAPGAVGRAGRHRRRVGGCSAAPSIYFRLGLLRVSRPRAGLGTRGTYAAAGAAVAAAATPFARCTHCQTAAVTATHSPARCAIQERHSWGASSGRRR